MEFFLWISCYFSFVFFHSFPISFLYFHPYPAFAILFALLSPFSFLLHLFSPIFSRLALTPLISKVAIENQVAKKRWEMKGSSCYGALSKNCFRFSHFHDQNAGKCIFDIPLFFPIMFWGAHPRPTMQKRRRWPLCFLSKSVPIP